MLEEIHKGIKLRPINKGEAEAPGAKKQAATPTLRTKEKAKNVQSEMAKIQMVALQMQRKRMQPNTAAPTPRPQGMISFTFFFFFCSSHSLIFHQQY